MSNHDDRDQPDRPGAGIGHETRDVRVRGVVLFAVYLVAAAGVVHAAVWGFYRHMAARADASETVEFPLAAGSARQAPPAPRLQAHPREELEALRREEEARLTSYAWIDARAGLLRIPIDRAMALVLERGFPTRESPGAAAPPGSTETAAGRSPAGSDAGPRAGEGPRR